MQDENGVTRIRLGMHSSLNVLNIIITYICVLILYIESYVRGKSVKVGLALKLKVKAMRTNTETKGFKSRFCLV